MANTNKPMGLVPQSDLLGNPWNGKVRVYYIASNDGNAFAIGDPVASSGDGDTNGIPGITIGVAGSALRGVAMGFGRYPDLMADPSNLDRIIVPASKSYAYYALVCDDPFVIYEAQEVGTGTQFTSAEIGLNCNLVAGTNNGYISGWQLDNSTEATTSTLNVKLLGLRRVGTNAYGAYAKWLVTINNHEFKAGTTGV